jgi:hypothetical protein
MNITVQKRVKEQEKTKIIDRALYYCIGEPQAKILPRDHRGLTEIVFGSWIWRENPNWTKNPGEIFLQHH